MTKDEALKLALEALEYIDLCDNDRDFLHPHECFKLDEAIAAIKQARSAPTVQEPVAQAWDEGYCAGIDDERTSEANIGIAGFDAKVEPARNNPYRTTPPAQTAPVQPNIKSYLEKDNSQFKFSDYESNGMRHNKPSAAQPAVPDAFGTREGEHPQYIQGWNDCRAEMQARSAPTVQEPLSELEKDAANLLFALHDAWPYVHGHCTIESRKKAIQALMVKHGDFADLHPPAQPAPVHFAWMRYEADCAGDPVLVLARSTEEGAFKVYKEPLAADRQWTDIDIDHLSVLAGFDPSHKVELGLVRSVVRTILRGETK